MTKQRKLIAVIALLVLANLWRMLSAGHPAEGSRPTADGISAADLIVNAAFAEGGSLGPMRRDVFQAKVREERPATVQMVATSRAEPPKSPAQMEQEAARTELSRIRLLGVVVREGKAQAYLAQGGETYLAFKGDTVANRFVVESVEVDSVELSDSKVNIRGRIPISGR
ncbi:MAG: hypothetical protein ACM3W8_07410 [Sideroxydans sp.]|nr:hypothetical protein [Sideroxyarcus sp.]